jgi:hypothetical protein
MAKTSFMQEKSSKIAASLGVALEPRAGLNLQKYSQ